MHRRDETLNCPECGEEFSILVHLKRHMREHDLDEDGIADKGEKSKDSTGGGGDSGHPPIDVTVQLVNNEGVKPDADVSADSGMSERF